MRKVVAIVGSAIFLVIAPGFVAGLMPWWISRWRVEAPFLGMPIFRFAGGILITLGLIGLLDSFARFALQGVGTPAPVFPTRHLVVTGLYRYVRNPMYVAVVITILGQGLTLGNVNVLEYGAVTTRWRVGKTGAGVPTPCRANRAKESRRPIRPSVIRMPPAKRKIGIPKKGASTRHREIHQGIRPATNPGAMTRKIAEPTIATTFLITSSYSR